MSCAASCWFPWSSKTPPGITVTSSCTVRVPLGNRVKIPPFSTVMLPASALQVPQINGSLPLPLEVSGITTQSADEGTPEGVQLFAINQSVLTEPFHTFPPAVIVKVSVAVTRQPGGTVLTTIMFTCVPAGSLIVTISGLLLITPAEYSVLVESPTMV